MSKITILFICIHNSCRSQIAEAFINNLYASTHKAYSAGIKPSNVNQYAVEVMKEIGINLSKHKSKSIEEFKDIKFDYIVTVCDNVKEICPFFPGKIVLHKSFEDPASFKESIEETIDVFRKVRDQ